MRRAEIRGYVIYDETELSYGDVASHLEHLLFNEDYPREWSLYVNKDEEIEWEDGE